MEEKRDARKNVNKDSEKTKLNNLINDINIGWDDLKII